MSDKAKLTSTLSGTSKISPQWIHSSNALCKYVDDIKIIKKFLRIQAIDPRYVIESTAYLGVEELPRIACVQACFCDIPFSKIGLHLKNYGTCGIAFDKSLMLQKYKIQPIHYINSDSYFAEDFRTAFTAFWNGDNVTNDAISENVIDKAFISLLIKQPLLENFLLSSIMYMKPIVKTMKDPVYDDGRYEGYVYQDECEWRYIPASSTMPKDVPLILPPMLATKECCNHYNKDVLEKTEATWMKFKWNDIRYLIVLDEAQRGELIDAITDLAIDDSQKRLLFSKIEISQRFDRDL